MPAAVRVQGLSKTYRAVLARQEIHALEGLSLEVAPGEVFGLLGPNGAGKTTLVKILLGIVHASAGDAALFGLPVQDPEARRRIGFLPENHRFPDFLTAGQMLDLYGRMAGVPQDVRARRIPELLDRVGMAAWRHTKIRKFSKGMMQRVGLAQALLNAPDLVFLDEPTDGVDPIGRREIKDLLLWLRAQGTTVFLNSHLLSEVEQVCTRVAILNKGRLVREGTVAELTRVEKVYEITATRIADDLLLVLGDALEALDGAPSPAGEDLFRYRVTAPERRTLNAVLDRLRSAGVEIEAVRPERQSLEDSFIRLVQPSASEPA